MAEKTGEPVALAGAINAAISATIGILTITETISPELAGGLVLALTAWIGVLTTWTRSKVTPVG